MSPVLEQKSFYCWQEKRKIHPTVIYENVNKDRQHNIDYLKRVQSCQWVPGTDCALQHCTNPSCQSPHISSTVWTTGCQSNTYTIGTIGGDQWKIRGKGQLMCFSPKMLGLNCWQSKYLLCNYTSKNIEQSARMSFLISSKVGTCSTT